MPEKFSRKSFMHTTSMGAASMLLTSSILNLNPSPLRIKAVVFDAFTLFDPRPIFKTVEELFPANGYYSFKKVVHSQYVDANDGFELFVAGFFQCGKQVNSVIGKQRGLSFFLVQRPCQLQN